MALSTARCSKLCAVTLSYHNDNTLIKPFSMYKRIEVENSKTRNNIRKIQTHRETIYHSRVLNMLF